MACQQGLTFRSTAQMATSEAGEELLPAVRGSPRHTPALTVLLLRGRGLRFSPTAAPGSRVSHRGALSRGSARVDGCHRANALVQLCLHRVMPKHFEKQLSQAPGRGWDARADLGQGAWCRRQGRGADGGDTVPGGDQGRSGQLGGHGHPSLPCSSGVGSLLSSWSPWPSEVPSSFSSQIYGLISSSSSLEQRLHQSLPATARHVGAAASAQESSNNR